jgi:hypothetical protein
MFILLAKLYSADKIGKNEVGGHVARMGKRRVAIGFWWGNLKIKRQLGRTRRKWEDNIKMDLQEMGWVFGIDWIDLSHDKNS